MKHLSYFGGVRRFTADCLANGVPGGQRQWRRVVAGAELFLDSSDCFTVSTTSEMAVLVRGQAYWKEAPNLVDPAQVAGRIREHYEQGGALPVDGLDGSFTLIVLNGQAGKVVLYRNPVGTGFTYYTTAEDGLCFGSNLAELVNRVGRPACPDREMLPVFFLFRFVPGRHTLFDGIYRLMPGEQVTFDALGMHRCQRQTFADLRGPGPVRSDLVDRIEGTAEQILAGWAAVQPQTANLLSGGVDSSYLQAVWNRVQPAGSGVPRSFSITVDHPRTQADTDYAVSAAQALGTRHTLVPANWPYAHYLIDTLAATGEPPNHVFAAYLGLLGQTMAARGIRAGLCAEGADSLFGTSLADNLRAALAIRRFFPGRPLRRLGAMLLGAAGRRWLPGVFRLADHVTDQAHPDHPVNQIAVFADLPAVGACFGKEAVSEALGYRRELLEIYAAGDDPLERLHAIGFLGEAADSASLWTTLFQYAGADLCCPFLDSRMLRLALNIDPQERFPQGQPKELLKRALARHVPRELVYRPKLGFGQPIYEWLAPGGQLRPWVEQIQRHPFVKPAVRATALARPSWFLYSLLCYDLWHRLFIERRLPQSLLENAPRTAAAPLAGY